MEYVVRWFFERLQGAALPVRPLHAVAFLAIGTFLLFAPVGIHVNAAEAAENGGILARVVCRVFSVGCPNEPSSSFSGNAITGAISSAIDPTANARLGEATTTVVYQTIEQPVIERVVERVVSSVSDGITEALLNARLKELESTLSSRMLTLAGANFSGTYAAYTAAGALGRIESLDNLLLTDATVNGISGLTDADIPDTITASNYFPLSGGSLTFASTTRFSVLNNAYFGATATSSFDSTGALTLSAPLGVSSGGTGWNSINTGSVLFGNGSASIATSSSLFWDNVNSRLGVATATPYATLSITNTSSAPSFVVEDSTSSDSTPFSIDATGNVGIGKLSPSYKLDVSAGTSVTSGGSNFGQQTFLLATPASAAAANYIGLYGLANYNSSYTNSGGGAIIGLRGEGYVSNARSDVVAGLDGIATSNSSDTSALTTSLYGARFQSKNTGTGRITHAIGFKVNSPTNNGTVDVEFGGYIAAISGGTQNSALHIEGAGSGNAITFAGDGSSGLNSKIYSSSANKLNIDASSNLLLNTTGGNIGIGTTSPWRKLSVTGTVGVDGLTGSTGAGSLCLTANKEVVYNSGSDACLPSLRDTKHDVSSLSLDALEIVGKLDPVSFVYNEGDGRVRYGFIAEDIAAVDSHIVTYSASGTLSGIDDRSILAVIAKAIQELTEKIVAFADSFTTDELRYTRAVGGALTTKELTTDKLCVGTICVTSEQFLRIVEESGQSSATEFEMSGELKHIVDDEKQMTDPTDSTEEIEKAEQAVVEEISASPSVIPIIEAPSEKPDSEAAEQTKQPEESIVS